MRTIFIHLRDASEDQVESFLTEAFPSQKGPPWILAAVGDPCLYIELCRNWPKESEPEEIEWLRVAFGGDPSVSLRADVSGRHAGDAEVRKFVSRVLSEFDGLAEDEFTEGFWTREEIAAESRKPAKEYGNGKALAFFERPALPD